MNEQEAEQVVQEIITLSIQQRDISERLKDLKASLKQYIDIENINDHTWSVDNGYIEVLTETKYKLADIPASFKVDSNVCAVDVAEKAFDSKIQLSKEGKKMVKDQYPPIMNLMIGNCKKRIKIVI